MSFEITIIFTVMMKKVLITRKMQRHLLADFLHWFIYKGW